MFSRVSFYDFTSEERYLNFQNRFFKYDATINPYDSIDSVIMNDFSINYKQIDSNNNESYNTKSFWIDFQNPAISNLANNFINNFSRKINRNFKYNVEERNAFFEEQNAKINEIPRKISEANYLTRTTKALISDQTLIAQEHIHGKLWESKYKFEKKIKAKLSQTELLALFLILQQNKIIDHPFDTELGHLISKSFLATKNDSESYSEIVNAGKKINDFKNSNKSINTALQKLKDIFQAKDFFELK